MFDFFSFFAFLSLFQCFPSVSCYVKQVLGSLHLFRDFFWFLRRTVCSIFLVNVSRIVCRFFLFFIVNQSQNYKIIVFYGNAHLHICSKCLRYDMSTLTEFSICRLNQVKNEHIPMKVRYLQCFLCTDESDKQRTFEGLLKIIICLFMRLNELNEFLQSKIKQKLSSLQKTACITAIADKEMIIVFCISGVLCHPTSICCSIDVVSSA